MYPFLYTEMTFAIFNESGTVPVEKEMLNKYNSGSIICWILYIGRAVLPCRMFAVSEWFWVVNKSFCPASSILADRSFLLLAGPYRCSRPGGRAGRRTLPPRPSTILFRANSFTTVAVWQLQDGWLVGSPSYLWARHSHSLSLLYLPIPDAGLPTTSQQAVYGS